MKAEKTYFLFGEEACRLLVEEGIMDLLNKDNPVDFSTFCYDPFTDSPASLLFAFKGNLDYSVISEKEYNLLSKSESWFSWNEVKDFPHDASVIQKYSPADYCWEEFNGVFYPILNDVSVSLYQIEEGARQIEKELTNKEINEVSRLLDKVAEGSSTNNYKEWVRMAIKIELS